MPVDFDKPIRMSTWTIYDKTSKTKHLIDEVMVAGDTSDIGKIATSDYYLRKIYRRMYGKTAKFTKAVRDGRIKVLRIKLHDEIYGYGVGCQ